MWFCLRTQQSDWLAVYRHQCKFHGKLSLCHFLFHQQSVFRVRSRKNSRREEKESAKKEATDKGAYCHGMRSALFNLQFYLCHLFSDKDRALW